MIIYYFSFRKLKEVRTDKKYFVDTVIRQESVYSFYTYTCKVHLLTEM